MTDECWVRSEKVLWRRVADGVMLLPLSEDEPFMVMASGAVVWDLLATPVRVEEAAEALAEAFGITTELAEADLRPFLDALAERSAVVRTA